MNSLTPDGRAQPAFRFKRFWISFRKLLIAVLFVAIGTLFLLLPILDQRQPYNLAVGDIAPEDIRAPREVTYVSEIETETAREAAAASVGDVYDPPDPRIGRQQVRKARQIMAFVKDVRADPFADQTLKQKYLDAIVAIGLTPDDRALLLEMSESQFEIVEREVVSLIEEAMSGPVREGHLEEVTSRLELKVSPEMPESLIPVTVAIARDLIMPNSTLNIEATEAARQAAVEAVPEIRHTYQRDEIVIRAGERVDALGLEALQELGLTTRHLTWEDGASALLISLLSAVLLFVYLVGFAPQWGDEPGRLLLVAVLFLGFLLIAEIMVPSRQPIAYLFPAAALALVLTALVGVEFAALSAVVLGMLVGYLSNGSLQVAAFTVGSALLAAASLRRTVRLNAYFLSGLAAAVGGLTMLLAFQLPVNVDARWLLQLLTLAGINGALSAGLALVLLFVVGNLTGITTSLQLIDLMRPDHPLQRRLQQEALGTYQHTLSVANLVEAAAEAIGADSLLARVGTLYHDVGKINNPGFFVENRTEGGSDPHVGLSPLASARIIKMHVQDGIELARRYRLPSRIIDFIAEHHGTMPIAYFLHQAREEAREAGIELDESLFFYDGPTPRSPETAILMMADGSESAARANRPATGEEIEEIVTRIIQQRLDAHQLDDSGLTLTDIKTIKDTFVRTLRGMYHPRVRYPGDKRPPELEPGAAVRPLPPGAETDAAIPPERLPGRSEEVGGERRALGQAGAKGLSDHPDESSSEDGE